MREPLIDRDALIDVIADAPVETLLADAVLDHLRGVLTPEALGWPPSGNGLSSHEVMFSTTGIAIHRRIFGEDG